ncbi:MAG: hypothetical protein ACRC2R_16195 [Xenococcaceae cyanobacterium]
MVLINEPCLDCGKTLKVTIGEVVIDRKLRWYKSCQCPYCGLVLEFDETGNLPNRIRQIILATEGRWNLNVLETEKQRIIATKIIRQVLNLSTTEAIKIKNKMPGVVLDGTHAEVEILRQFLTDQGLNASIFRAIE